MLQARIANPLVRAGATLGDTTPACSGAVICKVHTTHAA